MCTNVCLNAHMDVHHVHAWCSQRWEEGIRPPGLELQMAGSPHVSAGNWSCFTFKSSKCKCAFLCGGFAHVSADGGQRCWVPWSCLAWAEEPNCRPTSLAPDKGVSDSRLWWILWLQWAVQTSYALTLKLSLSFATANTFTHCFKHFIFLVLTLGFHKCKKGSQIQKILNSFVVFKKIHENKLSW